MEYILENVWTTDEVPKKKNVHVKDTMANYVSERPLKMKCMTVNTNGLHVIPGYVIRDFTLEGMDSETLSSRCKHLVDIGCTTVVTTFTIQYAKEFPDRYRQLVKQLAALPIDFVIGLSIQMTRITPSIIRECQKKKIPFIYAIVDQEEDMDTVIWEWIRNVNFPYTVPIIAGWEQLPLHEKRLLQLQTRWNRISKAKSITTITNFPKHEQPLSKYHLQEIGIYPKKGTWVTGSDIDYIVFEQSTPLAEQTGVQYDERNKPVLVVHKGDTLKVGDTFFLHPGEGKQLTIIRPGLFRAMSQDLL